jgi:protease PrsW
MLTVAAAAIAPALFWLWVARQYDRRQPEPLRWVAAAFALGMAVAVVAALLLSRVPPVGLRPVLVTPVIEEGLKFVGLWLLVRRLAAFDEPRDGILYAAALGLGFGTAEAIGYGLLTYTMHDAPGLEPTEAGVTMALLRGALTTPGHAAWTAIAGAAYAARRFGDGRNGSRNVAAALALAVALHAVFNLVAPQATWAAFGFMALSVGAAWGIAVRLAGHKRG